MKHKHLKIKLAMLAACILAAVFCHFTDDSLRRIKRHKKLTIITDNSSHGYYLYRSAPMGFEYDLAREFADDLAVDLEVVTPGWGKIMDALVNHEGDLIASSLTRTPNRMDRVSFSIPYMSVRQHIVVRKGNSDITKISDLNGKTIHIRKHTSYHERLLKLIDEGIDLKLVLYDNVPTEEFLRRIQDHEIDITAADSNIVRLNRRYYPDIKIACTISGEQEIAWAVRKEDDALRRKINRFFKTIKKNGVYDDIYNRYYAGRDQFDYVNIKKFHIRLDTRLPEYKPAIIETADMYDLDWRLIAAVIYQESEFDPLAVSYTGVCGLMQLTLPTAVEMQIENRLDPFQSIRGGVKYLKSLYDRFPRIDENERIKFALGSYNVGYGHIRDAQSIAREKGLNPRKWRSMEQILPLLVYPQYHENTRYGYARGTEAVRFVERVLKYYDILIRITGV